MDMLLTGGLIGLAIGAVVGLLPLIMGIRSKHIGPGIAGLVITALGGFAFGTVGAVMLVIPAVAVMLSYTPLIEDPFTSRAALDEVSFEESNTQYALRQMARAGESLRQTWRILIRNRGGFIGFVGVVFFIAMSVFGPYFVEYEGRAQMDRRQPGANTLFQPPSSEFPLGLDWQGRSVLSHVVYGGQIPILTSVQAGLIATTIAVLFGSISGLLGGTVDDLLVGLANLILTVPNFPLLLVLASIFSFDNTTILALTLGVLTWPALMRSVRAQVLSLREREYVEAAVALDLGLFHVVTREVFPQLVSYIAVNLIFSIRTAMYALVGLIILGMVPPREPDWGTMIWNAQSRGAFYNPDAVMMALAPIIAIALFQLSLILFTRSLEEMFNPRLRQSL